MTNCVRKPYRRPKCIQRFPERISSERELHLLRAAVAVLGQLGLIDFPCVHAEPPARFQLARDAL